MRMNLSLPKLTMLGMLGLLAFAEQASSATLSLSYDTIYNGSSVVTTGPGTINTPTVSGSSHYGNTFTLPTLVIPGTSYGFYDDYVFTIGGATANSVSTTIDLGNMLQITNLQQRLYNASGNSVPTPGIPVGGVINALTSPIGTFGSVAVLPTIMLAPGTYVLEIRGNVTGSAGGSYAGTMNLTAVPVPAAAWLLGSGLLGLVSVARRKA